MNKKECLIKKLKEIQVIEERPVILTSGKTSDYYCDIKKSFADPEVSRLISDLIIEDSLLDGATSVAGFGLGGITLATAVSLISGKKLCLVRETQKKYGTEKQIEGYIPNVKDKVVLIDDVLTTGKSLIFAHKILKNKTRCDVISGIVVVKRENPELPFKVDSLLKIDELR